MIYFTKLKFKNFLSTGNVFTEINLMQSKTTLIVGENGAGKSTLLDAICFALYNKAFRDINKPQLTNSINKKDLVVEVEFRIHKNEYKIVRGMKPTIFQIYINDVLLNQEADNDDYQAYIETTLLKMNYKTFCQVCILGTANFNPFMKLTTGARREIIEDILDLQIFTSMNSILKEKVKGNTDGIKECDYKISMTNEKIVLQDKYKETLKRNNDELIQEQMNNIADYKAKFDDEVQRVINNNTKREHLLTGLQDVTALSARLNKIENYATQLSGKKKKLASEIDFYENNNVCPTCHQDIDEGFKHEHINEKKNVTGQVQIGLKKLEQNHEVAKKALREANDILEQCSTLNMQTSVAETNMARYEAMMRKCHNEIAKLKEKGEEISKEEVDDDLYGVRDGFENHKKELIEEKEMYVVAAALLKDGGIKSKIIRQYIPIINKYINKYLAAMDFFVSFELNETFSEKIKSRFRDEFSYFSFSEGEKSRINLAILFTWRAIAKIRNSASTNLLIFDEIFDGSLDNTGTEEFMKMMNAVAPETNIIIISHKVDAMIDKFDRVIKFKKVKNFSEIIDN